MQKIAGKYFIFSALAGKCGRIVSAPCGRVASGENSNSCKAQTATNGDKIFCLYLQISTQCANLHLTICVSNDVHAIALFHFPR